MKLHHVGIAVASIEKHAPRAVRFGLHPASPVIHDPIQRAYVQFWTDDGGSTMFEFIEPASEDSPVRRSLSNGGGPAHVCFEVPDIEAAVRDGQSQGAIVVCAPVPAVAFENRHIAFLFFRGMGLVEFVQEPGQ